MDIIRRNDAEFEILSHYLPAVLGFSGGCILLKAIDPIMLLPPMAIQVSPLRLQNPSFFHLKPGVSLSS